MGNGEWGIAGDGQSADARSAFRTPHSALIRTSIRRPPTLPRSICKKNYRKGPLDIPVLLGVDLEVQAGEFLAIVGQSGSGKSTLLHLLGTFDAPTSGEVHFTDKRIDNLPAATRERIRNDQIGMIFQFYHLLPELTTLENVLAPLMIGQSAWNYWRRRREFVGRATKLLETVGLGASTEASAARTFRRRNATGRDCPSADCRSRRCCWPTSRPETSIKPRGRKFCEFCEP